MSHSSSHLNLAGQRSTGLPAIQPPKQAHPVPESPCVWAAGRIAVVEAGEHRPPLTEGSPGSWWQGLPELSPLPAPFPRPPNARCF